MIQLTVSLNPDGWTRACPNPDGEALLSRSYVRQVRIDHRQRQPGHRHVLPARPGVSRAELHSAPTRLLRQPGGKVSHLPRSFAPHGARTSYDTTAMSLLHAGVDIAVVALWLGHADIRSTQIYIHADMAIKERALARTTPPSEERICVSASLGRSPDRRLRKSRI